MQATEPTLFADDPVELRTCGECKHFKPVKAPYGYCHRLEGQEISVLIERAKLRYLAQPCSFEN